MPPWTRAVHVIGLPVDVGKVVGVENDVIVSGVAETSRVGVPAIRLYGAALPT